MDNSKKTLMFYINSLHRGGAQRVMTELAGRFAAEGFRVLLVTSFLGDNEYPVPAGVERISIEQRELRQSRLKKNASRIKALRKLIRQYKPDALLSFMAEPNFRAVLASFALPVKLIVSVRNDPEKEYAGKLGRFVGKVLMPMADGCVFQTEQAKAWFPEKLQRRSTVIMNQVDEKFFRTAYKGERRDIVTVGRLDPQKNHAMLIRAFARMADSIPDDLRIYGEGELENELRSLSASLGMEKRVRLMGLSSNVAEDIKDARLFVLPSDYEGMPNALLEAMALGLPCISTDCPCGGPATVIRSGENGLLVPVGDEQALAEAMLKLIRDDGFAARLGRNAGISAQRFLPEAVFSDWKSYMEGIIDTKETRL